MGSSSSHKAEPDTSVAPVVIVGGGYGGVMCAVALKKAGVNYRIVGERDYFHHNVAALRAAVDPAFLAQTAIPMAVTFGSNFVKGKVVSVKKDEKKVVLADGTEIEYSDLVLATGSTGPFPGRSHADTVSKLKDEYTHLHEEIVNSKKVVIIGGGAVGIELAGEIKASFNDKDVTVINSGDVLMSGVVGDYAAKIQAAAAPALEYRGVVVRTGEKVENLNELSLNSVKQQTVRTDKGNSYEADLVFLCAGLLPDTSLTAVSFASVLDDHKRVRVSPDTLQVEGHDHVFAVGDCCNVPQEKMAAHAGDHGELVADNIVRTRAGKEPRHYKQKFNGMAVTVGPCGGFGVFSGWGLPSFAVSMVKGKALFSPRYWGIMDQKMPA